MGVHAIVGGQWGDEGKGKIVDFFSDSADVVARYQGGANAGHTVYIDTDQFILHQVPSGILRPNTRCLLGPGMVVDPVELANEMHHLQEKGFRCLQQIGIAYNAQMVLPVHKHLDGIAEDSLKEQAIGTTRRGIGPTYSDRSARRSVPVSALLDTSGFKDAVETHLRYSNAILTKIYGKPPLQMNDFWDDLLAAREMLLPLIADVSTELIQAIRDDKNVIAEGAQGVLLDIDFGTYPYVTSSHPGTIGVATGLGIPPTAITRSTGIFKAYCTRVGEGPFPTELTGQESGDRLREAGGEYGATTGRPRRCGWFDGVLGNFSARINGFTDICITKADVLSHFRHIQLCTQYDNQATGFLNMHALDKVKPHYETFEGWDDNIAECTSVAELPEALLKYLNSLEAILEAPIRMVSTGPERSQIVLK